MYNSYTIFDMNVVHIHGAQVLITPHSHAEVGKTPFIVFWGITYLGVVDDFLSIYLPRTAIRSNCNLCTVNILASPPAHVAGNEKHFVRNLS